jgi:hypothetical protein
VENFIKSISKLCGYPQFLRYGYWCVDIHILINLLIQWFSTWLSTLFVDNIFRINKKVLSRKGYTPIRERTSGFS